MESVRDMTEEDLIHAGVEKIGHRKKIIKYAQTINEDIASVSCISPLLTSTAPSLVIEDKCMRIKPFVLLMLFLLIFVFIFFFFFFLFRKQKKKKKKKKKKS